MWADWLGSNVIFGNTREVIGQRHKWLVLLLFLLIKNMSIKAVDVVFNLWKISDRLFNLWEVKLRLLNLKK